MNIDTALAKGLQKLFKELEDRLGLTGPLDVYLAGGMAIHLYTGSRVTSDVDAEFGLRVLIPKDLSVEVTLEDGSKQCLFIDTNYNSTFGLMHEDYENDSVTREIHTMAVRHVARSLPDLYPDSHRPGTTPCPTRRAVLDEGVRHVVQVASHLISRGQPGRRGTDPAGARP